MSDFTAVDAAIAQIASEVIKLANSRVRVANVLTLLRNLIAEIELTPGENGLTAYEVAVADGYVGDQASWLLSLVGAPGAPGAPGADGEAGAAGADGAPGPYYSFRVSSGVFQIRLVDAEPADPWINLFYATDEIQTIVESEVPPYNTDQMAPVVAGPKTVTTVVQLQIPIEGTILTFEYPCQIGSFETPVSDMTIDLTTPKKCESWAFITAATLPTRLGESDVKWMGTAFSTNAADINFVRFVYLGGTKPKKILAINQVLDAVNPGALMADIVMYLEFEEDYTARPLLTPIPSSDELGTIVPITTSTATEPTSTVFGALAAYKFGLINSVSGTGRIQVAYNAGTIGTISSAIFFAVWLKLPSGCTRKNIKLIDTVNAYDGTGGFRVQCSTDLSDMRIYAGPTVSTDRVNVPTADGWLFDDAWHHYAFQYDTVTRKVTYWRDNVLKIDVVHELSPGVPKVLASSYDLKIGFNTAGGGSLMEIAQYIVSSSIPTTEQREAHYNLGI